MDQALVILLLSTLSIGFIHTLIGPDHYVPFIMLSKSRDWSLRKTMFVTAACGIGHVLSAVALGVAAAILGSALLPLEFIETVRGEIAAWLLTAFGFAYCVWGIKTAIRNKEHIHGHFHVDCDAAGTAGHEHVHSHGDEDVHVHAAKNKKEITPWLLFVIFIFGPCEPLIPLVMYPVARQSVFNIFLVTLVFGFGTVTAMTSVVAASSFGLKRLVRFPLVERFGNALAGGVICSCGLAITFLGM